MKNADRNIPQGCQALSSVRRNQRDTAAYHFAKSFKRGGLIYQA